MESKWHRNPIVNLEIEKKRQKMTVKAILRDTQKERFVSKTNVDRSEVRPLLRHIMSASKLKTIGPLFEPNHFNKPTPVKVQRKVKIKSAKT